jgi:hypothetical protein
MTVNDLERQLTSFDFKEITDCKFEKKHSNLVFRCDVDTKRGKANFEISAKLKDSIISIPSKQIVNIEHLNDINYVFNQLCIQFINRLDATKRSLSEILESMNK